MWSRNRTSIKQRHFRVRRSEAITKMFGNRNKYLFMNAEELWNLVLIVLPVVSSARAGTFDHCGQTRFDSKPKARSQSNFKILKKQQTIGAEQYTRSKGARYARKRPQGTFFDAA
jgi:hypothetical protein